MRLKKEGKRGRAPAFIPPMLATLSKEVFSSSDFIYETKLDGMRCIAVKKKKVFLYTRNHKLINSSFPEIVESLEKLPQDQFVLDGEIVSFEGKISSFSALQSRLHKKFPSVALREKIKVFYYVFDLLIDDQQDIRKEELIKRKELLKKYHFLSPVYQVAFQREKGEKYYQQAKKKGWEGVIAKNIHSTYQSKRGKAWLKFKCIQEQEMIIIGYTDPQGSRRGFGSLLLGYYEKNKLCYAGKVGTGFNEELLIYLYEELKKISVEKPPLLSISILEKKIHWVKPKWIAEVGFTEWTKDNKLRHPRFLGLRTDKKAKEVVREWK